MNHLNNTTLRTEENKVGDRQAAFGEFIPKTVKIRNEETIEREEQPEFLKRMLYPYKKVVYYLVRNGFIKERTPFCKHKISSCYLNSLEGFLKNFYYGFMVKVIVALLFSLTNLKKKLVPNLIDLFSINSLSFCAFLGAFSGVYKFVLCTLRRWRNKDDSYNALISGLLSGCMIMLDVSRKRRKSILMYIFCRALEALVNVMANKGYIKKIQYFEVYMFAPVISFLIYAYKYIL